MVQVDGKVRDRLQVPVGIAKDEALARALKSASVDRFVQGREPARVIYVAGRILNILTG